jgi:uncharacterized protein (DUF697 family)
MGRSDLKDGIDGAKEVFGYIADKSFFGEGELAKKLDDIIKIHALISFGTGFIPVPGADSVALLANTWTMYARINSAVGVSLADNFLKSIASGVLANVVSMIPAVALGKAVGFVVKLFPGIGTAAGATMDCVANVAITYTMGVVYLKSLEQLVNSGRPLTGENLRAATDVVSRDKSVVESSYEKGKEVAKNR